MRSIWQQKIENPTHFKKQLLHWGNKHSEVVFLDSHDSSANTKYSTYDAVLAVEAFTAIKTDYFEAFQKLDEYQKTTNDWLFGYLSYDLKNNLENLKSENLDELEFPELYFFQPQKLFLLKGDLLEIQYLKLVDNEIKSDLEIILNTETKINSSSNHIQMKPRWEEEEYLSRVQAILNHIQRGDIYEVNFCQEFFAKNASINLLSTYENLSEISKAPFSTFLRLENFEVASASPERFVKKIGQKLISQPIKGTAKRSQNNIEDLELKTNLAKDSKEISENVMIVDLVRNDLSKTAEKASVSVEELCEIYSFEQVHQMISTVTSSVKKEYSVSDILASLFPMGSMTGAPKVSAMKIAEKYESTKRGLYSGAIGYIAPTGDFDFNVVIRSLLYNTKKKYLSYMVGGAITSKSKPKNEFEECQIKGKALQSAVNASYITEK
ncbi:anthranilate synthase component I family protein [Psychroflexus aestuariivivens]|uniref:anthranilate synthase component I family protein n=1 Tax=Psychroflexus aestuariivivens TaxID=1795040 RepID=UPI000FD6C022|nr:anthranilate synthase component I family protein [Psychroflexus aestuariivivens]